MGLRAGPVSKAQDTALIVAQDSDPRALRILPDVGAMGSWRTGHCDTGVGIRSAPSGSAVTTSGDSAAKNCPGPENVRRFVR